MRQCKMGRITTYSNIKSYYKLELDEEQVRKWYNLLNSNLVRKAKHFQYKVEVLFKEMMLDGPYAKTKYYAFRDECHKRGSPHIHAFITCIKNLK